MRDVLHDAVAALARAGVDTPELDAQLLLADTLGLERERLILSGQLELGPEELARFQELVARRADREPVAYILGRKPFRWITLSVDRRVLIPRPETELLVDIGLALPTGSRVVDVGTGSGAVALALAFERPDLEVWGTDLSAGAIAVAQQNAQRLGLNVQLVQGDLLDGVPASVDAALANLPYVAEGTPLEPEISRFEPGEALFAGPDGLAVIRRMAAAAEGVSLLALEIAPGQADASVQLLRAHGFRTQVHQDLAGHDRVVLGSRDLGSGAVDRLDG